MDHRRDLEGLRGIAILSVVLYHLDASLFPGGFIGVDIFFVLSGFLITGILVRDLTDYGRVRLGEFWGRRARRILPAGALVLLVTAIASLFIASPIELAGIGRDISAAGYYGFNWRAAARSIDYLALGEDRTPVLHYWSLAVEEQFYLLWPLLILALFFLSARINRNPLPILLAASGTIWIASLILCVVITSHNQPFAFFGTLTRAWQLLTGGTIAIYLALNVSEPREWLKHFGIIGLVLLIAGFALTTPDTAYPGYTSLLPAIGAGALILAGSAGAQPWMSRIVGIAPLTFIGRISYAWYLWHWPILLLGREAWPSAPPAWSIFLVALSFAAAVLTYYIIENPIRYHRGLVQSPMRSLVLGAGLTVVTIVAGFGVLDHAHALRVYLGDKSSLLVDSIVRDRSPVYQSDCHLSQLETQSAECTFGAKGVKPTAVLFGDSHAAHLFDAMEKASLSTGASFLMRSKSACPALDGRVWNIKFHREYFECQTWRESVVAEIERLRPKLVILSSASIHRLIETGDRPAPQDAQERLRLAAERKMVLRLMNYAEQIAVVDDTPRLPENPIVCLYQHPEHETACAWKLADLVAETANNGALADLYPRVLRVDLNPLICPDGLCSVVRNGKVVMYDESHMTASFSADLRPVFQDLIEGTAMVKVTGWQVGHDAP
jgi:peptidoglycan/LPS O-acetylase OafA/YrhL